MSGLLDRLRNGGSVVVAEGYIFEFERRGYLQAGTFVPEVILDHPELVRQLYEEFVHAGSDVVLALTYYAHREKLRVVGLENDIEEMNTTALKLAREVADKHDALMAGNICNSTIYVKDDPASHRKVEELFREQIELAVKYGADFIVAETFGQYGEAKIALDTIKKYGGGVPAVITLTTPPGSVLFDDVSIVEACRQLEEEGAAVVGLNCGRGPATMLPLLEEIKKACKGPIAALPVTYRTSEEEPTFFNLKVPGRGKTNDRFDSAILVSEGRLGSILTVRFTPSQIGTFCFLCLDCLIHIATSFGSSSESSQYPVEGSEEKRLHDWIQHQ